MRFSLRYLLVELIGGVLSFSLYMVHVVAPLVSGGGGLEDLLTWQLWFLLAMALVVIVYIDDMGWNDLGCTGSAIIDTPNLDDMAADGLLFEQAYANAPNCAPSRACLLTGLWSPRHGVYAVNRSTRGRSRDGSAPTRPPWPATSTSPARCR